MTQKEKQKKIEALKKGFAKMVAEAPPHDYYSYWPGDDTRTGRHGFSTTKDLCPHCQTCGEIKENGVHLKDKKTGRIYDYTLSSQKKR